MWELVNHTPFSAFSGFDRNKDGHSFWLVWVKATFEFRDNKPCLFHRDQLPIYLEPLYLAQSGVSELLSDSDVTPPKKQSDILFSSKYYPGNKALSVEVSACVGNWEKKIKILPQQVCNDDLEVEVVPSCTPIILGYQHAYGGISKDRNGNKKVFVDNPIGTGFAPCAEAARGIRLPRLVSIEEEPLSWDREVKPVALSALPRENPQRSKYAGTYDKGWARDKSPLLPDDFDERFWQMVPEDQVYSGIIEESLPVRLNGLTRSDEINGYASVGFVLPKLQFDIITRFKRNWNFMEPQLQTLHFLTDRNLLSMCYCAAMPILAVANDVEVEKTIVSLRGYENFNTRMEDVKYFDPLWEEEV